MPTLSARTKCEAFTGEGRGSKCHKELRLELNNRCPARMHQGVQLRSVTLLAIAFHHHAHLGSSCSRQHLSYPSQRCVLSGLFASAVHVWKRFCVDKSREEQGRRGSQRVAEQVLSRFLDPQRGDQGGFHPSFTQGHEMPSVAYSAMLTLLHLVSLPGHPVRHGEVVYLNCSSGVSSWRNSQTVSCALGGKCRLIELRNLHVEIYTLASETCKRSRCWWAVSVAVLFVAVAVVLASRWL